MLDRARRREVSVRPADDDRLAGGDLPLDLCDDQPEPRGRQAAGRRRPAMEDRPARGRAKQAAARALTTDPQPDQGGPWLRGPRTAGPRAERAVAGPVAPDLGPDRAGRISRPPPAQTRSTRATILLARRASCLEGMIGTGPTVSAASGAPLGGARHAEHHPRCPPRSGYLP